MSKRTIIIGHGVTKATMEPNTQQRIYKYAVLSRAALFVAPFALRSIHVLIESGMRLCDVIDLARKTTSQFFLSSQLK